MGTGIPAARESYPLPFRQTVGETLNRCAIEGSCRMAGMVTGAGNRGSLVSREVTVRVPLEESLDLLESPIRACIGFIRDGQPQIEPVHLRYEASRYLVGIEPGALVPDSSEEVVLVVDEGVLFFELRAIYVRGLARLVPSPLDRLRWVEVEPSRVSSWNYGRMRWKT